MSLTRTFSQTPPFPIQNFMDFITVTNLSSGGAIGTAINTVDQYQGAYITQTTGSQTITLPSPTGDAPKSFVVVNTGSVSFTMYQRTVFPGTCMWLFYSGISIANIGKTWVPGAAPATITTTTSTTA